MSEVRKDELTLCAMDIRRSPTQAPLIHRSNAASNSIKTVSMKIYTGDLWVQNPEAHIYVMVDGYIDSTNPKRSLQGRGICVGHVPIGTGVAFEHFGAEEFLTGPLEPITFQPNEFYDIWVICDDTWIEYVIDGPDINVARLLSFGAPYPTCDTVIGVAGDRCSSTFGFFNVMQNMSKYRADLFR